MSCPGPPELNAYVPARAFPAAAAPDTDAVVAPNWKVAPGIVPSIPPDEMDDPWRKWRTMVLPPCLPSWSSPWAVQDLRRQPGHHSWRGKSRKSRLVSDSSNRSSSRPSSAISPRARRAAAVYFQYPVTSSWRFAVEPTVPIQIRASWPPLSGTSRPLAQLIWVLVFTVEEVGAVTVSGLMKA